MDSEKVKIQIGANISQLRRQTGVTQAELAEKLNYSDKAVSKWERGESIPDVVTLVQMARLFGVSVDALVGEEVPQIAQQKPKPVAPGGQKGNVLKLSSVLVWFVALTVYVVLSSVGLGKTWVSFVYAVPVNAVVLLILQCAFRDHRWNFLLISLIVWGVLLSLYVTLLVFAGINVWRVFLLGILGQVAVVLWFRTLKTARETKNG